MRIYFLAFLLPILVMACKNKAQSPAIVPTAQQPTEPPSYFPVTAYIKGQLREFEERSMNPLLFTTIGEKTDSVWLKVEEIPGAVKEFLTPQIDTSNMAALFKEEKFRDQTLNTFTFTYDPVGPLPDSISLRHWDVYVDVETGKVKKVYLVKKPAADKTVQLTWVSGRYCTIVTIAEQPDGTSKVESEQKVTWDF